MLTIWTILWGNETLYAFLFGNVRKYELNDETFRIQLYFDSYKSSTDWQWNEKCKNYKQLHQLKMT